MDGIKNSTIIMKRGVNIKRKINMKIKKNVAVCIMACTVATSTLTASASAKDSVFPTQYISSSSYYVSKWRYKDNTTSHYIKNTSSLELRVISYSYSNVNRTKNGSAVIPGNSERFINNFIRERYNDHTENDSRCKLSIRCNISGASGKISGAWSPDSVGSYIVANP